MNGVKQFFLFAVLTASNTIIFSAAAAQAHAPVLSRDEANFLFAVEAGDVPTVKGYLRNPKFNRTVRNQQGDTALHIAATNNQTAVLEELFKDPQIAAMAGIRNRAGKDFTEYLGKAEVKAKPKPKPEEEKKHGVQVEEKRIAAQRARDEANFLHAAAAGDIETVENYLKQPKFNVGAVDARGNTVLHSAAQNNHPELVDVLLKNPRVSAIAAKRNKAGKDFLAYVGVAEVKAKPVHQQPAHAEKKAQAAQPQAAEKRITQKKYTFATERAQIEAARIHDPLTRTLLIFLNDDEISSPDSNAITAQALSALSQKAGPILISTALLGKLFSNAPGLPEIPGDFSNVLTNFALRFDASEWVRFQVGSVLNLLIPIDYIRHIEPRFADKKSIIDALEGPIDAPGLTPLERSIGLKINHLTRFSTDFSGNMQLTPSMYNLVKQLGALDLSGKEFMEVLEKNSLFITQKDGPHEPYHWVLYLTGHGGVKSTIAGLSMADFKKMVNNYLDKRIKVKLFAYGSCYAAGFNSKQVYGELTSAAGAQIYPFTIVTDATTDAPTYTVLPSIAAGNRLETPYKFNTFVQNVSGDTIDYAKALENIFVPSKKRLAIPLIRPAHVAEWFPLTQDRKIVLSITEVMVSTRIEPLKVFSTFEENPQEEKKAAQAGQKGIKTPEALFIYVSNIEFPIDLSEMPGFDALKKFHIVSMKPGRAIHQFSKIKSDESFILLSRIFSVPYGVRKIFWFKKWQKGENESEAYKDVIIDYNPDAASKTTLFFTNNDGEKKRVGEDWKVEMIQNDYVKEYRDLILADKDFQATQRAEKQKREQAQQLEKALSQKAAVRALPAKAQQKIKGK